MQERKPLGPPSWHARCAVGLRAPHLASLEVCHAGSAHGEVATVRDSLVRHDLQVVGVWVVTA